MSCVCPLCLSPVSNVFYETGPLLYYHCANCDLRFLDPACRLSLAEEKARYLLHQNDITDAGYRNFVRPLHDRILERVPVGAEGLDFGSGKGSALSDMLSLSGYRIKLFDPIFHPDAKALEQKYDLIVACEVVEHLFEPNAEFHRLRSFLKAGGLLGVMTSLWNEDVDFANWYYRRDPTHVAFYSKRSFLWISNNFNFSEIHFFGPNVIVLVV